MPGGAFRYCSAVSRAADTSISELAISRLRRRTVRWLFDFLYGSVPAEFESRFGLEESVRRLSIATRRFVFLITKQVAVGRVSENWVSLSRVMPFYGNFFYFFGGFHEHNGRVVLSGRFALSWFAKAFMTFWLGFTLLWTSLAMLAVFARGDLTLWLFPLIGAVMFGAGLTFVWFLKRMSRNDIAWLSRVIRDSLSR